jgi:hypothetical protein
MERPENGDSDDAGLLQVLVAVALGAVALDALRKQKRLRAGVAGVAAIVLGYTATAESPVPQATNGARSIETRESGERGLRCGICGEPIVPGEGRRPHADYGTVHDACLEEAA